MHKQTKYTDIPKKVKEAVYLRDNGLCIFCGRPGDPVSHVVRRSQGGLGIEENIVTACNSCHRKFDEGRDRNKMYLTAVAYLKGFYPDWSKQNMIYRKGITDAQ